VDVCSNEDHDVKGIRITASYVFGMFKDKFVAIVL